MKTEWRAVAGMVHAFPVIAGGEKHQIRSGAAGCWCEPEVHEIGVKRLGDYVRTAVHQGITVDQAHKMMEMG